ncbi:MAG: T9SS type A sorting domain-containing protein, partial [Spirochaetota bacterium]|nr:T9SS type A sorting domain-containing protein [Spirochaetota bacterium]
RGTLTIDQLPTAIQNRIQIFDINGDLVFDRSYAATTILWGGRNNSGRVVKPGLYIIRITSDDGSGGYGKKLIRILVDYR